MIKVVHVKKEPFDFYIGRNGRYYCYADKWLKALQNPYPLGNGLSREYCVDRFKEDMYRDISNKGPMYDALIQIILTEKKNGIVTLGCWCKPAYCHGDVIVKACEELKDDLLSH